MGSKSPLQEFPRLSKDQFDALEASILKFGVRQPILFDTLGHIIDGHHRYEIAVKHGIEYPFEEVKNLSDSEKRELMISLNLCRRQLTPAEWGGWFKKLLQIRGVKRGRGRPKKKSGDRTLKVAEVADELGVPRSTAFDRMKLHDEQESGERGEAVSKPKTKTEPKKEEKTAADQKPSKGEPESPPCVYLSRRDYGDGRVVCIELDKKVFRVSRDHALILREGLDHFFKSSRDRPAKKRAPK
jgi:ParB-like chromosome segregation protein Spo0J